MSEAQCRPYEPKSTLFLSCDLTGSTAFKQRPRLHEGEPPWQKVFLQFYREFPQQLARQTTSYGCELEFNLWKAIGDELIFTCDVASEVDVCQAINVWVRTLDGYKTDSLQHEETSGLGVKGGVFLATFPGPDHESSIPRVPNSERSARDVIALNREALRNRSDNQSKYIFDYFGPSIDTGFRVLSRCDSRYLTLSVEVALILSLMHGIPWGDGHETKFPHLVLKERMELKGVWNGRSYPVFALDLEANDPVNAATRKFFPSEANIDDIRDLCLACYESRGWPFRAYLPNTVLKRFVEVPVDPLQSYLDNAPDPGAGGEEPAGEVDNPLDIGEEDLPTRPSV